MRPDDLTVQMVQAALAKVPALDPATRRPGCWEPATRLVRAVFSWYGRRRGARGLRHPPGVTVNRYCSSSLQTTRMAFHAIKAGEGRLHPGGRRDRQPVAAGGADLNAAAQNPHFAAASERTCERAPRAEPPNGIDPRQTGDLPDVYIAMGQTVENVAQLTGITRRAGRVRVRSQNLAE